MKVIIVTGSVGTGKTVVAKKLAEKLNFYYLDVNKIIRKYNISEGYDRKRKTKIVDINKLNKVLIKEIIQYKKYIKNKINKKNGIVIDSHLSHYLPKKYADLCIVTKCNLKELQKRLKKRKYSKEKIRENLDTEIFDICFHEAKENKHKILIIDSAKSINIDKVSNNLIKQKIKPII
ncbi:AAA family ATPase [archaeon AH-315-M20]|nr:AAA family ATPase [archaeon AH-315-M20]